MTRRVYLFDNATSGLRYNIQWSKFIPKEIESWGYEVVLISGIDTNFHKLGYRGTILNSGQLLMNFSKMIMRGWIPDNSIFIFPEARNPLITYINELKLLHDLPIITMGWWSDHTFNVDGNFRYQYAESKMDWTTRLDRTLLSCYDYNLMCTDRQYTIMYDNFIGSRSTLRKCGLPFSSITSEAVDELLGFEYQKENRIVINTRYDNQYNPDFINLLKALYSQYEFHVIHEQDYSYKEYYKLLRTSKAVLSISEHDSSPWTVYEALSLGAIPILPNSNLYTEIFTDDQIVFYGKHLLNKPFIKFLRKAPNVQELLNTLDTEYDDLYSKIDVNSIHDKYFNSNNLKDLLNGL